MENIGEVPDNEFNNNQAMDNYDNRNKNEDDVSILSKDLPNKRLPDTCLRFGIDTILNARTNDKLQPENSIKDTNFSNKNALDIGKNISNNGLKQRTLPNINESEVVSEATANDTETCDDVDVDYDDVTSHNGHEDSDRDAGALESRVPYIHFPLAYQALRSSSVTLTSQQSVFPLLNSDSSWSTALVADYRKERFTTVRRVGHPYQNRTPPKRKKPRTSFSRVQIVELEKRFERQKYLASTERSALAKSLKMSDAQVKTWFQNRRTKWRRQTAEERELERQAANRLLLSLQSDTVNRKSAMILSPDRMCLSQMKMFQERRASDT